MKACLYSMNWTTCKKNVAITSIVFFLVILFRFSEQGPLSGHEPAQLYGPGDQVYILNATTIKERVSGSSRAWVVEFFSSWCGHCIHFAPKWKQFAQDLAPWQNIVVIAGLDCADDNNVAICRDYEIMGYPSLRFFPPHSPVTKKITKDKVVIDDLYRGEAIDRSENIGDLKRSVIDMTLPFVHNYYEPDSSTMSSSISDSASLWEFIKDKTTPPNTLPSFAFLIFEKENSHITKEIAMTLSKYPAVAIFRFTKKNTLYTELKLDGWPAAGYVKRDTTSGILVLNKNQNVLVTMLTMIANIANLPVEDFSSTSNIRENVMSEVKIIKEDSISNNLEEPSTSGVISIEDLLHAVRNLLKNEVGLLKQISGAKLTALKNFLHTLAEFFPADRHETLLFLMKLSSWLAPLEQIDDTTYMDKLTELELQLHPWDIDVSTWSNCRGSMPGRRGYPCSLWNLFHTLTVVCLEKNQQFPVLDAIHGYIKEFFGCKECSEHFTKMVADDGALMITPIKDQVLWLWKAHNKVNQRLKGTLSEDPAYPKIQYPSETQCSECYGKDTIFDEDKVLKYLLNVYSKPERTMQPIESYHERIYSTNERRHSDTRFFTDSDYWLLCIVYLSVAGLLVFGYVHFRVRKGAKVDISYLFCRKLKHHYITGKNNV